MLSLLSTVKEENWVGRHSQPHTVQAVVPVTKYIGLLPRFCMVTKVVFPEKVIVELATVTVFTAFAINDGY